MKKYIPVVFKLLVWCGAEVYVSGLQNAGLLALLWRLVWVTEGQFEKEGSGHLGIVPESVCLLGGGTGSETARKGVTSSRVGGACLS